MARLLVVSEHVGAAVAGALRRALCAREKGGAPWRRRPCARCTAEGPGTGLRGMRTARLRVSALRSLALGITRRCSRRPARRGRSRMGAVAPSAAAERQR